jgi:hypothetical protein
MRRIIASILFAFALMLSPLGMQQAMAHGQDGRAPAMSMQDGAGHCQESGGDMGKSKSTTQMSCTSACAAIAPSPMPLKASMPIVAEVAFHSMHTPLSGIISQTEIRPPKHSVQA